MESTVSNATMLMAVGMTAVFTVLFLVVTIGNTLINVMNILSSDRSGTSQKDIPPHDIDHEVVAVITAAVNTLSGGKGKIERITKSDK